ncbi:MAG: copper resistance protein CopC [Dehalococcoidia bacterium]
MKHLSRIALVSLTALILLLSVERASAAADLARATPAPGSQVEEATRVDLSFSQEIAEATVSIDGEEVGVEIDGDTVSADASGLDEGEHSVEWAVTSDVDEKETAGSYTFTVGEAGDGGSPPEVDPETRAERVDAIGDKSRTEVVLYTALGAAILLVFVFIFYFFRSSFPAITGEGIAGGLPPPGQSPPEHHDDDAPH